MADSDKKKDTSPTPPGPGDPEWEANQKVLRGEVDPTDPNKLGTARRETGADKDDENK